MKSLLFTALLILMAFSMTGCSQKDSNGQPMASSFSSTGMFNGLGTPACGGGDVCTGGN